MELRLIREGGTSVSTEGSLYVDGVFECYTLEDAVRATKVWGKTAIPAGRYKIGWRQSPKFNLLMPWLLDVPDFEYVYLHWGNKPEDTDGCILVGMDQTRLDDAWISRSRLAFNALYKKMIEAQARDEDIWITIEAADDN